MFPVLQRIVYAHLFATQIAAHARAPLITAAETLFRKTKIANRIREIGQPAGDDFSSLSLKISKWINQKPSHTLEYGLCATTKEILEVNCKKRFL